MSVKIYVAYICILCGIFFSPVYVPAAENKVLLSADPETEISNLPEQKGAFNRVLSKWMNVAEAYKMHGPKSDEFHRTAAAFDYALFRFTKSREYIVLAAEDNRWKVCTDQSRILIGRALYGERTLDFAELQDIVTGVNSCMLLMTLLSLHASDESSILFFKLAYIIAFAFIIVCIMLFIAVRGMQKSKVLNEHLIQATRDTIAGMEAERSRIAREIHDTVLQDLKSYALNAASIAESGPSAIEASVQHSMNSLRSICMRLVPPDFEKQGLIETVDAMCSAIQNTYKKTCRFAWKADTADITLRTDVQLSVYRIIQEAVHNAVYHAESEEITVVLTVLPGTGRKKQFCCFVTDDGKGFDIHTVHEGLGLRNMKERAQLIGAELAIDSSAETGTQVKLTVPFSG